MNAAGDDARRRLEELLRTNGGITPEFPLPRLTRALAEKLIRRIESIRLFAHPYAFIHNLTYGRLRPVDVAEFASQHGLSGLCMHVRDGGRHGLSHMSAAELADFRARVEEFGLALHLEVSSTARPEIDRVVELALALGVQNIRVYSRYAGRLSEVLEQTYQDLGYLRDQAVAHDLHFDFEQHEDLKSREIAALLRRVNHPRINALFDFANMLNAHEAPLDALRALRPHIRQVHLKGARWLDEQGGYAQLGVVQGGPEDDLPAPRMLFELLLLGDEVPQVLCFALEQEVGYYAPPFRRHGEPDDCLIRYREPSETPLDRGVALARHLLDERRWAVDQVSYVRDLLGRLRSLAEGVLAGE